MNRGSIKGTKIKYVHSPSPSICMEVASRAAWESGSILSTMLGSKTQWGYWVNTYPTLLLYRWRKKDPEKSPRLTLRPQGAFLRRLHSEFLSCGPCVSHTSCLCDKRLGEQPRRREVYMGSWSQRFRALLPPLFSDCAEVELPDLRCGVVMLLASWWIRNRGSSRQGLETW